jgi:hypothetical protein
LIDDRAGNGALWHAGPALHRVARALDFRVTHAIQPPGSPLEAVVMEHELREDARLYVRGFDFDLQDADYRENTLRALTVLKAPKDLIERVRNVR